MTDTTGIVVRGGDFAGLESTFLLRAKLGDRAHITVVSDRAGAPWKAVEVGLKGTSAVLARR